MSRAQKILGIALVGLLLFGGCGSDSGVGEDIDLDKIKGGKGLRLGENSPSPGAVATSPAAQKGQSPPPAQPSAPPQAPVFEVTLVNASPYFLPGNTVQVSAGTLIRFTNKDTKDRAPYVTDLFEAPTLKPGDKFEYFADRPTGGSLQIDDRIATFKIGYLEVS